MTNQKTAGMRDDTVLNQPRRGKAPASLAALCKEYKCLLCNGIGKRDVACFGDSTKTVQRTCTACKGHGFLPMIVTSSEMSIFLDAAEQNTRLIALLQGVLVASDAQMDQVREDIVKELKT